MKFKFGLHITLDDTPSNRKLTNEEKSIVRNSILTRYKPKPDLLESRDPENGWFMPISNDLKVEACFEKPRYPTPTEILEVELKAREIFPGSFN